MWRDSNESRGFVPLLAHKHYIEHFSNFSYRFRGKLYRDNYRYRIIAQPYTVLTPDRWRKSRICHVNMLKSYADINGSGVNLVTSVSAVNIVGLSTGYAPEVDGLIDKDVLTSCGRFSNSAILSTLQNYLSYLSEKYRNDIIEFINKYPSLFNDVPTQINRTVHDIDVGQSTPIKQHAYRVNPCKRQAVRDEVGYLVRNGFAVASQSPWSSPCIILP